MNKVTDRAGRPASIAGGTEADHSVMTDQARVWSRGAGQCFVFAMFFFFAMMLSGVPIQASVTEFVVPTGPRIALQDGRTVPGHIIEIDQTNIVILTGNGARETLPRSTVESVTFKTITGDELNGELVGWSPGVYEIATPSAAIKIYSAMPHLPEEPVAEPTPAVGENAAPEEEASPPAEEAVAAVAEPADDVEATSGNLTPFTAAAAAAAAPAAGDLPSNSIDRDPSQSVANLQDVAASPDTDLSIEVSVENSHENGPPVAFNIELSKPSESSVVLIYATIDGTAVNGQDYEANRGVVVIKAGEQNARIEATVLDLSLIHI